MKVFILAAALSLFIIGGCVETDTAEETDSSISASEDETENVNDVEISDSPEITASSDEDSEYDPDPTDINYDNLDAGIPDGFPEVIPVYDLAHSTVLGGTGQNAGGTMVYNLVIGSNDQVSDVTDDIHSKIENISMDVCVEGSSMIMGYMGDWDYTITVDNGEADGYTTVISYSIVEKQ